MYPVTILLVKLSILLLYLRIFQVDRVLKWLVYGGIIFQTLFYTAMVLVSIVTLTQCDSALALSKKICKDQSIPIIVQGVVNTITDFYVLVLPIARVVQLQIPFRRKVGLSAIFLTGLS